MDVRSTLIIYDYLAGQHLARGGGGGGVGSNYARTCVSKCKGHGSFFSFKGMKRLRVFHSKLVYNLLHHSL